MKKIDNYPNYSISETGDVINKNGKTLSKHKNPNGYMEVTLYGKGDDCRYKRNKFLVHRIVAFTFLSNKNNKNYVVNHKNGVKDDNRLENLEIVTYQENTQHAWKEKLSIYPIMTEQKSAIIL